MLKRNIILFKVISVIILLIILEFLFTLLIYILFPRMNMEIGVQVAIDLSLLVTFLVASKFFFNKNKVLVKNSIFDFRLAFIFLILAFIWVYISPIFKYPFFSYNLDFSGIDFTIEKFSIINDKSFFSYYSFIRLLLITPILEELLFRRLILANLFSRYNIYISIVITSLLFSFCHLDLNNSLIFFIGSIILCLAYLKTRDIRYSIILHILMNFITLVLK
ncbi:lysostaphin resistance A-like protein [Flavobacterium sp. C4GT6]|uniref:CPBP family intramembrane glutamic endopeptidase n=1 Tax=Flavobacterium sp. C4GT6 TaxID=3103818 RepID=UPI003FA58F4D